MPSRVLLVSANRCTTPDPVFPLGLAYLDAALRRAGHDTVWLDILTDEDRLEEVLETSRPDFVGISLRNIDDVLIRKQQTFFGDLASLGSRIRAKSKSPIIAGGSGFSIFPERLLELSGADFGLCGEGEAGFVSLLEALEKRQNVDRIPGLVFRQDGRIRVNPTAVQPLEKDLVITTRPASSISHYLQASGVLNVQTQRGCGFRCCYCTYPLIEGRQHRRRTPELVADEFEQMARLGAKYVYIVDSVFNSSPQHVTETCEALLRRQVKLRWCCFLRPKRLSPALMKLMVRAGLSHAEFGSDSFCDEVLEAYHKDFTFDDILRSNELARQEGVDSCHFLIAGGPGETKETLRQGFHNSERLQGAVAMAVVGMRIYPGTSLFERAVREGCISRDADLLAPAYYVTPGLTAEDVFAELQGFARVSPRWIVGDPQPAYTTLVQRLRSRGVLGPLWSYFAMLQRIQPPSS
jgi:radical SAM superfamily enzyme YgiQ (UPF0313 family)